MNRSAQAFTLWARSLASTAAALSRLGKRPQQALPASQIGIDLDGFEPISIDCRKKSVPIFTVYQY